MELSLELRLKLSLVYIIGDGNISIYLIIYLFIHSFACSFYLRDVLFDLDSDTWPKHITRV